MISILQKLLHKKKRNQVQKVKKLSKKVFIIFFDLLIPIFDFKAL